MSRIFLVIITLVTGALNVFAADNNTAEWQRGNAFYEQKLYDSAAACYERIAALKPHNAEVYYNLGNAYYKLNKTAPAILNYERALRISPEYKDARENLSVAQARITNRIQPARELFFTEWWKAATRHDKTTTWAVWAAITFFLCMLLMVARRFAVGKNIPGQLAGVLFFASLCLIGLAFSAAGSTNDKESAVVMVADAPLMNSEQKGKPLMLVPEGTTVKIKSEKGVWVEVTLPDGRKGWLQQSVLERV